MKKVILSVLASAMVLTAGAGVNAAPKEDKQAAIVEIKPFGSPGGGGGIGGNYPG